MKAEPWDWFMQLGSDDFFLPGVAKVYKEHMKEHDFAGFRQIAFHSEQKRETAHSYKVTHAGQEDI